MDESPSNNEVLLEIPRPWPKASSRMVKVGIILLSVYILISMIITIVLFTYPNIVKHVIFMDMIKYRTNFTQPETLGIDRVHNFYLDVEPRVSLGIWHFRSPLIQDQFFDNDEDYFEKHLRSTPSNIPIIIYLHGNAFDRSLITRRELCKRLRDELKYDVITFDYRGFGDSTGEPTESGLMKDARFIYDWLNTLNNGQRKIYLWGHSLGSAVACQLAARLSDAESKTLGGIVMEAPFINTHQALLTHWFSLVNFFSSTIYVSKMICLVFRWQPWYYSLTERALRRKKLLFETRDHLINVNCPCVLLHADDDFTVPYIHSKQLLQTGLNARVDHKQKNKLLHFTIDMISYHHSGYGHRSIYQAPKLISALKRIIFDEDL